MFGQIFGDLYTGLGLEDIYGVDLANYLWGNTSSVDTSNQFITIGFITFSIAFIVTVFYYYFLGGLLHKPSLGSKFSWFVALLVNSALSFLLGWQYTLADYYANRMVYVGVNRQTFPLPNIGEGSCLAFGLANAISVAVLFFLILTFILKWGSRDFRHIPF